MRFQDAYVENVVDTLNDLPNVLWILRRADCARRYNI
jgi:hypothetical protein